MAEDLAGGGAGDAPEGGAGNSVSGGEPTGGSGAGGAGPTGGSGAGGGESEGGLMFKIDNVQASIFGYEVANVSSNIVSIFGQVISDGAVDTADPQALARLNRLMGECLAAMQSPDYLLLADLLEYRLKPLIGGMS